MPTETQLEQRVAALQSDLNERDQRTDDLQFQLKDREGSRRDWLEGAQRLEKENEELRSEVKRLDLMVSQADHDYEMKRNDLERQLAKAHTLPQFAQTVIRKLKRFRDCAEDGQGADIGKTWFDVLVQLGLLNRVQRSPAWWEITDEGDALLDGRADLSASAEPAEPCSVCGDLGVLPGLTVEVTKCSYCGNGWETIAKAEAELRLADQKDRDALRALLAKVRKFGWSGDDAEHIARTRAEVIAALERKKDNCELCGVTGIEPCTDCPGLDKATEGASHE